MEPILTCVSSLPSYPILGKEDATTSAHYIFHHGQKSSSRKCLNIASILEREGIAEHLFGILDPHVAPIQLCRFAQTCRWAWEIVRKDELWRELYFRRWPDEWTDQLTPEELQEAALRHGWRFLFAKRHRWMRSGVDWERYLNGGEHRLSGHTDFVSALVEFDGAIYSASLDGTIRRWDRTTLREVSSIRAADSRIWSLTVWGHWLASSHGDGAVRLWDAAAGGGECRHVLTGHRGEVNTLAVCGEWLVSGSDDMTVRVWSLSPAPAAEVLSPRRAAGDLQESQLAAAAAGGGEDMHYDNALARPASPAGGLELLLSTAEGMNHGDPSAVAGRGGGGGGGGEGGVATAGGVRWRLERTMAGHTDKVYALTVWRGKAISGSVDATIRVWDVTTGAAEAVLRGHGNAVTARLLIHGRRLFSCSRDRTLRAWAVGTWEPRAAVQAYPAGGSQRVYCLAAAGGRLVSGSADAAEDVDPGTRYEVRVWDSDGLGVVCTLPQPPGVEVYTLLAPAGAGGAEVWAAVGCSLVVWGHPRPAGPDGLLPSRPGEPARDGPGPAGAV